MSWKAWVHSRYLVFLSVKAAKRLLTALALRELGREAEANQWVASWKQQYPDNRIVAWSIAVYEGRLHEARMMLAQRDSETDTTPWETSYRDVDFDLIARYFSR